MDCGKITFETEKEAKQNSTYFVRGKAHKLHVYKYRFCHKYHHTSNRRIREVKK